LAFVQVGEKNKAKTVTWFQ